MHELRVILTAQVTSFFLHTSYELLFIARVTSYFLHTSYELLFITQVTGYFYCTSYELLFNARVTSYSLLHEIRINFYMRVTSYFLTTSYNKDKDDKAVYDNNVMVKNYPLRSFLIKNLELAKPHFRVISI